ncbi:MAG: hypothetical protein AAGF01_28605, partial [Cyanobacteria bacterium P01_G01_bin.38]
PRLKLEDLINFTDRLVLGSCSHLEISDQVTEVDYDTSAPVGHLPWPGASSLMMERMLQESGAGCGSCSIDVMYLSSDRFADYLDTFLGRVNDCLCSGESALEPSIESP